MSIDAVVTGIAFKDDGTARLTLEQPDRSRCAGQDVLTVVNATPYLQVLMDQPVWGGADTLMHGETRIGRRVGYTRVEIDYDALFGIFK